MKSRAMWKLALLLGVGIGTVAVGAKSLYAEAAAAPNPASVARIEDLASVFKQIGHQVEPSVVNIAIEKTLKGVKHPKLPFDDETMKRFFPDRDGDGQPDLPPGMEDENGDLKQFGQGSGVIIEVNGSTGYIVTNNHVAGGANEMVITLADGRQITNGKLLGADPKSDLAVIKVEADNLVATGWGDSDKMDRGDWVMAFGSPFGYVGSMTHGIVSALNRQAGILGQNGYENFIQVDAPINPGNSGGPLVNIRGEVVGINTAIASRTGGFQGIGFAIPANQAKGVYAQLKDTGKVVRGWLGVSISDVARDEKTAKSFGWTDKNGVIVQATFPGTPAHGKLQAGDIVTGINGKDVKTVSELRNTIAMTAPGQDVKLKVFRDGKTQDISIKVGEQPEDPTKIARGGPGKESPDAVESPTGEIMGLKLATPNEELTTKFGLEDVKEGAIVTAVDPKSASAKVGLRPGDLITRVGKKAVTTAREAKEEIAKLDISKGIRLYVTNREGSRFVFVQGDK